jgi:hypothetical protein
MPLLDGTGPRIGRGGCHRGDGMKGRGDGGCRSIATADPKTLTTLADRLQRRLDAIRRCLGSSAESASGGTNQK